MQNTLPDIFEYVDFRKYLEDYRTARKAIEADFQRFRQEHAEI
jgi:hypothetical protein